MLVRFTTTENDVTTSPLLLKASNQLSTHIRSCMLSGLEESNIHMIHGRVIGDDKFEFVWDFGHFSIEDIRREVDFPGLLSCEAHELHSGSTPSIIANVGRIVEDDGRDEPVPF